MRSPLSLVVAGLLWAQPAFAETAQVVRGPLPAWATRSEPMAVPADAGGLAFTRRQDVIVHLDRRGQQQYNGIRLKILHPNALQAGNVAITWNPASGSPVVHAINIYRGSDVIDVLKTTSFEVLRREDQLEAARLDGQLTAVLRVPDLRVGDEIEIDYTIRASDPTLGSNDAGALFLASSPGPGRYRLELKWEKGMTPRLKMTADMAAVAVRDEGSLSFRFDNPRMQVPPKDSPPRFALRQRFVEFSAFDQWADVSRQFAPLFARAAVLDGHSPLKAEAARIASAHASPLDRAAAALKLVQQDVRYVYVGLDRGDLTPASAEETWRRRYGDCKAKTALLIALLTELGVSAEPVLVNTAGTDDGLNDRLPSPRAFDHVLVRARIGERTVWMDGTLPPVAPPSDTPVFDLRWVLPVSDRGSGLQPVTWHPQAQPDEITLTDIDARGGFDGVAKVSTTSIVRGVKGLQQQVQLSAVTPQQLEAAVRQNLTGSTWQSIDSVKWHYDVQARASILSVVGTQVLDWQNDGEMERSLALPGGGFNPPDRRVRAADQDQSAPFLNKSEYSCYVTTVRIPNATKLENWSTKESFDTRMFGRNYYRAFDRRDGTIRMVRGSRTTLLEIDPETARKDNDRIPGFDNSMGWIFYDPSADEPLRRADRLVPTTDGIDWTAPSVPCLAVPAAPGG